MSNEFVFDKDKLKAATVPWLPKNIVCMLGDPHEIKMVSKIINEKDNEIASLKQQIEILTAQKELGQSALGKLVEARIDIEKLLNLFRPYEFWIKNEDYLTILKKWIINNEKKT